MLILQSNLQYDLHISHPKILQPKCDGHRVLRYGFFPCRFDMIFFKKLMRFRYDIDNLANPLHDLDSISIILHMP